MIPGGPGGHSFWHVCTECSIPPYASSWGGERVGESAIPINSLFLSYDEDRNSVVIELSYQLHWVRLLRCFHQHRQILQWSIFPSFLLFLLLIWFSHHLPLVNEVMVEWLFDSFIFLTISSWMSGWSSWSLNTRTTLRLGLRDLE